MGNKYAIVYIILVNHIWRFNTMQAEASQRCTDYKNRDVDNGVRFIPEKSDLCVKCTCEDGFAVACSSVHCSPPNCELYEAVKEECCEFNCITASGGDPHSNGNGTGLDDPMLPGHGLEHMTSSNLPLRLVASTVTSFLILALLLFMVHRLRQRRTLIMLRRLNADQQDDDTVAYLPQMDNVDIGIEFPPYEDPPPPYTPPKPPYVPHGEAPPPYESRTEDTDNNNHDTNEWSHPAESDSRQCNDHVVGRTVPNSEATVTRANEAESQPTTEPAGHRSVDRLRRGVTRRGPSNPIVRQSTSSLHIRNNVTDGSNRRAVSLQPRASSSTPRDDPHCARPAALNDDSYGFSVAVAALAYREDPDLSSPSSQVVLRMEKRHSKLLQRMASNNSDTESDKFKCSDEISVPQNTVSQFIKRSNSIEIRRGSSSPRNSFYQSTGPEGSSNNSSMESAVLESPGCATSEPGVSQLMEAQRSAGAYNTGSGQMNHMNQHDRDNNQNSNWKPSQSDSSPEVIRSDSRTVKLKMRPCVDEAKIDISKELGYPSTAGYPLGWDPGRHTPVTDGSSTESSERTPTQEASCAPQQTNNHARPYVKEPFSSAPLNRQIFPPSSLELPLQRLYVNQSGKPDAKENLRKSKIDNTAPLTQTLTGPRSSYQGAPSNNTAAQPLAVQSQPSNKHGKAGCNPAPRDVSPESSLVPMVDTAGTSMLRFAQSPSIQSPVSPGLRPFIRSGSVTSQVSLFSVCSETGERKRPTLSLPPDIIGNDAPYPISLPASLHHVPPCLPTTQAAPLLPSRTEPPVLGTTTVCSQGDTTGSALSSIVSTTTAAPLSSTTHAPPAALPSTREDLSYRTSLEQSGNSADISSRPPVKEQGTVESHVPAHHNIGTMNTENHGTVPKTQSGRSGGKTRPSKTSSLPLRPQPSNGVRTRAKILYRDEEEMELREVNPSTRAACPQSEMGATGYSPPSTGRDCSSKSTAKDCDSDRNAVLKLKSQRKRRPHSNPGTLDRTMPQNSDSLQNGHLQCSGVDESPEHPHRSGSTPGKNNAVVSGQEPQIKQYGFIDRPEVLNACKDNVVYPEAGDKVPNLAYFEKLRHRSLSRERHQGREDRNSSGYSSKSTGNDRSGASSGERSRSASRSRSRERTSRRRHHGSANVDNRRWSEPPVNMNAIHKSLHNGTASPRQHDNKVRSPRRRKKKRGQGELNGLQHDLAGNHPRQQEHNDVQPSEESVRLQVQDNRLPPLPVINGFNRDIAAVVAAEPSNIVNNNILPGNPTCSTNSSQQKCDNTVDNQQRRLSTGPLIVPPRNDNEDDDIDLCR